jgi:hypothetical protein
MGVSSCAAYDRSAAIIALRRVSEPQGCQATGPSTGSIYVGSSVSAFELSTASTPASVPRRLNTQAPNPCRNSLAQPMKHRANIAFRYAPILALAPFSLLVADTFAEPLQRLPNTDCLGREICVDVSFD